MLFLLLIYQVRNKQHEQLSRLIREISRLRLLRFFGIFLMLPANTHRNYCFEPIFPEWILFHTLYLPVPALSLIRRSSDSRVPSRATQSTSFTAFGMASLTSSQTARSESHRNKDQYHHYIPRFILRNFQTLGAPSSQK
jgi:hypothetical protein